MPTMTPWWRGRPTMEGKTARGASSPAKPALHMPEPLSTTRAATSSSHILFEGYWNDNLNLHKNEETKNSLLFVGKAKENLINLAVWSSVNKWQLKSELTSLLYADSGEWFDRPGSPSTVAKRAAEENFSDERTTRLRVAESSHYNQYMFNLK